MWDRLHKMGVVVDHLPAWLIVFFIAIFVVTFSIEKWMDRNR